MILSEHSIKHARAIIKQTQIFEEAEMQPKSEPQCSMCGHSQPCGHRRNSIYCRKWYAAHLQESARNVVTKEIDCV